MFDPGNTVVYNRNRFKILRVYPKAGVAEMKCLTTGKVIYIKPYFMQWVS